MRVLVPRLAARRPGLRDERAQPLRAAVHGGGEARRPAAEDDEVEALAVDLRAQTERPRDLRRGRVAQDLARVDEDRRLLARDVAASRASRRSRGRCRRRTSGRGGGCARGGRGPRTRAASRAAAMSRMTPWPALLVPGAAREQRARRGLAELGPAARASRRSPGRSKAMTSVGSTATHALIVGSPVNAAMSPMNVRASACATWMSLPGLRSTNSTRPRSMTKNGASRGRARRGPRPARRAPLALLGRATRSSRRTAAGTGPRRRGPGSRSASLASWPWRPRLPVLQMCFSCRGWAGRPARRPAYLVAWALSERRPVGRASQPGRACRACRCPSSGGRRG